jgi:uncharacterized protein (DUF427 family)
MEPSGERSMPRRPENIVVPGPGQESVWDYPRPPDVKPDERLVTVVFAGKEIAHSNRAIRVLETSHPPTFYIPPGDVLGKGLRASGHATFCEFKGQAIYFDLQVGGLISKNAAWCYPEPRPPYEVIAGCFSFYPSRVEECTVGGKVVVPQPGDFYGGWITPDVVGPFKGDPGTMSW